MTTEIAIINNAAVALAADSAMTISGVFGPPQKSLNTSNKLFNLSKFQPVGIMIYNAAEIFSIPWESIIKVYRKRLGRKSFPKLAGYWISSNFSTKLTCNPHPRPISTMPLIQFKF